MSQQTYTETLHVLACARCSMPFGITSDFEQRHRDNHDTFYCPNGHPNYYSGKSESEKLKQDILQQQERMEYLQKANNSLHAKITEKNHEIRAHKGAKTRLVNRIKAGVCPCCNRSFENLRRHMANKHPEQNAQ